MSESVQVLPPDQYNRELIDQTHPNSWINPTPEGKYNLVAIGGGSAGIISALGAAGLGGRAALIEKNLLGGDCLNYGCVPSKALIRSARVAYQVATADDYGIELSGTNNPAFPEVMQRMRRLRAEISRHDSAKRFTEMGVDVHLGSAKFTGPDSLEVSGRKLKFHRCVIATGARAAIPPIEGLREAGALTNETLFSLTKLPERMIVLGAGPIGVEMAQAFRRFGSEVHIIDMAPRILPREDPEAATIVQHQFQCEGINLHLEAKVLRIERNEDKKRLIIEINGRQETIIGDEILVAAGRAPNTEGLNLEAAGVVRHGLGIQVDDRLRTTNPRIFAAGDIVGSYQFTHAADAMARICVQNALFFGRKKLSRLVVPHATYTDPEIAHVGLTPQIAAEQNVEIDSYRQPFKEVDRAVLDGRTIGFAVVHCRRGTGKIAGATIVGHDAGELIGEVSLMMTNNLPLSALAKTIHCYPTRVEVLRRIGDQFSRSRLTPRIARLFKRWLAWQR